MPSFDSTAESSDEKVLRGVNPTLEAVNRHSFWLELVTKYVANKSLQLINW